MAQRARRRIAHTTVRTRGVEISSPERLVWPSEGITKLDLVRYYDQLAEPVLRFIRDRPLVLRPFPRGVDGPSFWLQDAPKGVPPFVRTWRRVPPATGRAIDMVVGGDVRTLIWMIQYNVVELHSWLATIEAPDQPDFAVLELDAHSGAPFELVVRAARLAKTALDEVRLLGFPKLSGGSGIHVLVPLEPRYTFDEVRGFVKQLGQRMAAEEPQTISTDLATARERKCVYLDYPQNGAGKSLAIPYSVRARPGAPVSAPLHWDELQEPGLQANYWDLRSMPGRLEEMGDLMQPAYELMQHLPAEIWS